MNKSIISSVALVSCLALTGCEPRAITFGTVQHRTDTLDGMPRHHVGADRMAWELYSAEVTLPEMMIPERITYGGAVWESVQMRPWTRGRHVATGVTRTGEPVTVVYRTDWDLLDSGPSSSAFAGKRISSGHNWMGSIGCQPFFVDGH